MTPFDLRGLTTGNHRLPCPSCAKGPRDTALSVTVEHDGSAVWICFRCGLKGGTREQRTTAASPQRAPAAPVNKVRAFDAFALAERIWQSTVALAGTAGEDYLRSRLCITPPADGDLRFHPGIYCADIKGELPALVARVSTVIGNRAVGVHRIWIRAGETKAVAKKRLGGSPDPVCIRLWPDDAVTMGLGIAEGVETACGAAQVFKPMWSTIDAGQMERFPILPGIESLTVFADHDKVGCSAANAAVARYVTHGAAAVTWRSPRYGEDICDVLMRTLRK